MTAPTTFIEWFEQGLRAKLAELPSDQARYRHLALLANKWRERAQRFSLTEGASVQPHPIFGMPMTTDFHGFLAAIDTEQHALEAYRVAA